MRRCYLFWNRQKSRCENPKNNRYKYYGQKGIKVEYSFDDFWTWWEKNRPADAIKKGLTIGRKDHNKNYTLDNIEIQTVSQNTKEMLARTENRRLKICSFDKKTGKDIAVFNSAYEAAKKYNLSHSTVLRQAHGLTKPIRSDVAFRFLGDS